MPQDEDLLTESFSARRRCFSVFQRITVVSNIIFALFALLLIVLGGIAVKDLGQYSFMAKVSVPAGLIVLGFILLVIIVLGLYGSFKKSTKFLGAYFILLFLFIICEFGVGGGAYGLRSSIPTDLAIGWAKLNDVDRNGLQSYFYCCGWLNTQDNPGSNCVLNITNTSNSTASNISASLMEREIMEVFQAQPQTLAVNSTTPCEIYMVSFFQNQLYTVGTIGIVFATLQLVALISSIVVFGFIKIEQRRSQDERF